MLFTNGYLFHFSGMTDYRAEQKDEIEAIESIYSEEISIISDNPHRFTIPVKTEDFDEEERNGEGLWVLLKFTFPDKYPDEAPEVEIEEEENMDENMRNGLREKVAEVAEENLGMAMVFTIVSEAIQWLGETQDRLKEEEEARIKKIKDEADAEEQRKLEGTKVTIESFLAWKAEFDREMREKKGKELEKQEKKSKKKTGRELFLTDTTLNDSDVKFLAETGDSEAVTVDESLFEDLDDLDLEDSDDPDFCPDGDESD